MFYFLHNLMYEKKVKIKIKKLDISYLIYITLFICLLILTIKYNDNHDYLVYYTEYNNIVNNGIHGTFHNFEIGYRFLEDIGVKFGLTFKQFYSMIMIVCLLLLSKFFNKALNANKVYSLLLFFIFPYINYLQQIRSSLCAVIIMNGLENLYDDRIKGGVIKYIVIVLLCSLIQTTSIIYLSFLLIKLDVRKIKRMATFAFLLVLIIPNIVYSILKVIILYYPFSSRILYNISESLNTSKFAIFNVLVYFALFLVFTHYGKHIETYDDDKIVFLYKVSMIIIMLSLFVVVGSNAYRASALMIPIVQTNCILIAKKQNRLNKIILLSLIFILTFSIFFAYWGPLNPKMYNRLINEMWKYNLD